MCGIMLIWFVTVLLGVGSLQFSADAQRLVLRPIEEMAAFVKRMAEVCLVLRVGI